MTKLTEGQSLWWVPTQLRHANQRTVTVTKVGRKWAQLDNGRRIDIESMHADGGEYSSPGCCYLSEEYYKAKVALVGAWNSLCATIRYKNAPDGITLGDIAAARKLLKLPPA